LPETNPCGGSKIPGPINLRWSIDALILRISKFPVGQYSAITLLRWGTISEAAAYSDGDGEKAALQLSHLGYAARFLIS
jgi:hypothetical protein